MIRPNKNNMCGLVFILRSSTVYRYEDRDFFFFETISSSKSSIFLEDL